MEPIRMALIGLGRFAALHAPIWAQMQQVEITAICDQNPDRFAQFQKWFPNAEQFMDWQEMLSRREFDAVSVLTPEQHHEEPALAALSSGAHVFVEKPLASHPDDALQMLQTAEKCKRILMTGHLLRFDQRYREVKRQLDLNRLGPIRSIYAKRANGRAYFSIYNRVDPVFILGIHDIDLLHWFYEDDVREVYARGSRDAEGRCDMSWAQLSFERGGIGILENHWLLPEGAPNFMDVRMEIIGELGQVHVQEPEQAVAFAEQHRLDAPTFFSSYADYSGRIRGPLAEELEHFVSCVVSGQESPYLRPLDAYKAVQVAWAVKQSIETGQVIRL